MKKAWAYVGLGMLVVIGVIAAGTPRGEEEIRGWLIGGRTAPVYHCAEGSWKGEASEGEVAQEGEIVTVRFSSEIALENLWAPFGVSGPVSKVGCAFSNWGLYVEIVDVTNNAGEQPGWWDPGGLCPGQMPGNEIAQIWKVTGGYANAIGIMGSCWFWVCPGMSSQSGSFSVGITNLDRVSTCEFNRTDATVLTMRFDGCVDENGDAGSIEWSGSPAELDPPVASNLTLSGTFEGCLHKGKAGRNYITQEMNCSHYPIDISEWEELFCADKARGYGDNNIARWEAVEDFVGDDCADDAWACGVLPRDPDLRLDFAGRLWLAVCDEGNIRVYHRPSPRFPWEEHTPAFDEWRHVAPSIQPFPDRRIMVAATPCDGNTELRVTRDEGMSWDHVG